MLGNTHAAMNAAGWRRAAGSRQRPVAHARRRRSPGPTRSQLVTAGGRFDHCAGCSPATRHPSGRTWLTQRSAVRDSEQPTADDGILQDRVSSFSRFHFDRDGWPARNTGHRGITGEQGRVAPGKGLLQSPRSYVFLSVVEDLGEGIVGTLGPDGIEVLVGTPSQQQATGAGHALTQPQCP
jgi:hypothetical protein